MTSVLRPPPGPARDYSFPRFEQHRLANGMAVIVAPIHKLPIVTVHAVVDAGAAADPPGKEGLAAITARLLAEGTQSLEAAELNERVELLGSSLVTVADWDYASASLTVMQSRFGEALRLLADVIIHPALPERELTRLREERLAELLQMRTEPRSLADEMYTALLYDPASRYAKPAGGSVHSVKALEREDAARFHSGRYTPSSTTIIVCGDIEVERALSGIEAVFGSWGGEPAARPALLVAPARRERRVHLIAKEGAPQSELRIGHIGLPRVNDDYFRVAVLNAIFGGLFSSRVNLNLRERHGYTYGAFSHFDWRRAAGPFVISTAVRSDVTVESIREVLGEMEGIIADPVSGDELSLATSYMVGVFPIRFETTAAIASALASLVVFGLPASYYDDFREKIAAITAEDVLHAAVRHLRPWELQIVVVGDPAAVRSSLERFAPAELTVHGAGNGVLD